MRGLLVTVTGILSCHHPSHTDGGAVEIAAVILCFENSDLAEDRATKAAGERPQGNEANLPARLQEQSQFPVSGQVEQ